MLCFVCLFKKKVYVSQELRPNVHAEHLLHFLVETKIPSVSVLFFFLYLILFTQILPDKQVIIPGCKLK